MPTSTELFAEVRTLDQAAGEIETRVAELRQTVNSAELPDGDRETKMGEYRAGLEEHLAKLGERDAKRKEAGALLDAEDWQAQGNVAKGVDTRGWTPEMKEQRKLAEDIMLTDYLTPMIQGTQVQGKAEEYRQAIWGTGGYTAELIPLEFLLPKNEQLGNPPNMERSMNDTMVEEHRVDTLLNQSSMEGAATTATRVFATGDAAFLGAQMPMVNSGDYNFPVITGGNPVRNAAGTPGTEVAATAATVALGTAEPKWFPASVDVSVTSLMRHPGLNEALQRELAGQLMEAQDTFAIAQLIAGITAPTAPTANQAAAAIIAIWRGAVDGRYSLRESDLRMLLGADSYNEWGNEVQANIGYVFQMLPFGSQIRASAVVAATASNLQHGVIHKGGRPAPNSFVVPTWRGIMAIRDVNTDKREGIVGMTSSLMMDAVVPRGNAGPYAQVTAYIA